MSLELEYIYDEYEDVFGVSKSLTNCEHLTQVALPEGSCLCEDCGIVLDPCPHINYVEEKGVKTCNDCSRIISTVDFKHDWNSSSSHSRRPSSLSRSLDKDFDSIEEKIDDAVRSLTERRYFEIVGNKTSRMKSRKGLIAACLFMAYADLKEYRTSDYIRKIFKIEKNSMRSGLTLYYKRFPNDRDKTIKPSDLICRTMTLADIKQDYLDTIVKLAEKVETRNEPLLRSQPQSVAAAIVYFFLCLNPKIKKEAGLTKTKFAKKVMISDITITKLAKELVKITGANVKI